MSRAIEGTKRRRGGISVVVSFIGRLEILRIRLGIRIEEEKELPPALAVAEERRELEGPIAALYCLIVDIW